MTTTTKTRPTFGELLLALRGRTGQTLQSVARGAGVDASYVSRLESGQREAPSAIVVLALARALDLEPDDRDALLNAAGFPPAALAQLGMDDRTVRAVARVLADEAIPAAERAELRQAIGFLVEQIAARRERQRSP